MTHNELKEMGLRIKNRRLSLKYTQEQFAEMIGISASSYTKIENAFQQPSLDTLIMISKKLNNVSSTKPIVCRGNLSVSKADTSPFRRGLKNIRNLICLS